MFANLLIILASSLVVIALFRRLQLPPVLGYLCVGLAVGPTALDWVNDSEELPDLAELGVVFLLFLKILAGWSVGALVVGTFALDVLALMGGVTYFLLDLSLGLKALDIEVSPHLKND